MDTFGKIKKNPNKNIFCVQVKLHVHRKCETFVRCHFQAINSDLCRFPEPRLNAVDFTKHTMLVKVRPVWVKVKIMKRDDIFLNDSHWTHYESVMLAPRPIKERLASSDVFFKRSEPLKTHVSEQMRTLEK